MKRGKEYHGCGEEYNVGEGKQYHLPYNINAGKNIKRGRGTKNLGKKIKIQKNGIGEAFFT